MPDDRSDRRSIIVPQEIWQHVERWALEQDKSEAAVVRGCIEAARAKEVLAIELFDSIEHIRNIATSVHLNLMFIFHKITHLSKDPYLDKELSPVSNALDETEMLLRHVKEALDSHRKVARPQEFGDQPHFFETMKRTRS